MLLFFLIDNLNFDKKDQFKSNSTRRAGFHLKDYGDITAKGMPHLPMTYWQTDSQKMAICMLFLKYLV